MAAKVAEEPSYRRVVLTTAGLADRVGIGPAHAAGPFQAGDEDPHLYWVERRRHLVPTLQGIEQLEAHDFGEPRHRELVQHCPGPLACHPCSQIIDGDRLEIGAVVPETVVVKGAEPARADALAAASRHRARLVAA
jgi:hypothetical protein